jgi:hypothetical protein
MTDHVEMNRLNWDERAAIHARSSDRMWRLPDGVPRIPLSYSVRAKKAGDWQPCATQNVPVRGPLLSAEGAAVGRVKML